MHWKKIFLISSRRSTDFVLLWLLGLKINNIAFFTVLQLWQERLNLTSIRQINDFISTILTNFVTFQNLVFEHKIF